MTKTKKCPTNLNKIQKKAKQTNEKRRGNVKIKRKTRNNLAWLYTETHERWQEET